MHSVLVSKEGPCFWRCHNEINPEWRETSLGALACYTSVLFLSPLALPPLCSPVGETLPRAPGTSAFLLNGLLTLVVPQLYAISLTGISMADGANGPADRHWVSVKELPDWWLCWLCASEQTQAWKLHRGSIFQLVGFWFLPCYRQSVGQVRWGQSDWLPF